MYVSPLDPECENIFEFDYNGCIRPQNNNVKAASMIKKVNLDKYALTRARKGAIEVSGLLDDELLGDEKRKKLLKFYTEPDENGMLPPFCDAIVYILNNEI